MSTRLLLKQERYLMRKNGHYFEGHHILPKCKGGSGTSHQGLKNDNIVYLTAREHFIAHWLLWLIYRDRQMALAFHKMISINKKQNRFYSSIGYEEARIAFSKTNKGNKYNLGKTRVISTKQRELISISMKGRFAGEKNYFYGKKHTIDSRIKISEKAKKRKIETYAYYKGPRILIKNGVIIGEFKSSSDVAKFIGCSASNVRHVLGGSQKTVKGYIVKYKNETL